MKDTEDINKKPRKPRKPLISKISTPSEIKTDQIDNFPAELLQKLDERLAAAIKQELKSKTQRLSADDYKPLETIASEFLKAFLIIGYTLTGEKIVIGHATNQLDHDALVEHLRQTFFRHAGEDMQ